MKKIKLFCLPYAGGASIVYKKWKHFLSDDVELCAIELSGRGKRALDPMYGDATEAINDVYKIISSQIKDGGLYAIYGHSMGSMLAYEVAQMIRKNNLPKPVHMFFLGRQAPHMKAKKDKIYHEMPEEEFKKEILNLGGTPKEFFEHPELMEYLIPILKNDFKISETAIRNEVIDPMECDITVFMGREEELEPEEIHGWMLHTKQICTIHYFNGGHFFVNEETERVVNMIDKVLMMSIYNSGIPKKGILLQ